MDYSKFVTAVIDDDREELNKWAVIISRVLFKFLRVRLNAPQEDSEDCVQSAILHVMGKIKEDKLHNPDTVIYYLFTTAKNEYLKMIAKRKEVAVEEIPEHHAAGPGQLERLLDDERQRILKNCVEKLTPDQADYISYWFANPADDAGSVAEHFNISVNNAWIKKHRIIQTLKNCVDKIINL